jgi:hypothetical protein
VNIDLKSSAIGLALGLVVCGGWYAGSTRQVINRLVEEKAQATGRANQLEQEKTQYKILAEHWFAVAESQTQAQPQQVPQDPAVAILNGVRPGLGTVTSAAVHAVQNAQAQKAAQQQQAAAQEQAAYDSALDRQKTELHCPSGHCAACDPGWKLFSTAAETYCVREGAQ